MKRASARTSDTAEIKALEQRLIDGIKTKDAQQIMSCYSDDVFANDVVPPRQYVGATAFQKPWQGFLDMFKGPINAEVNDLVINSDGKIAYSRSVHHVSGTTNEGKPFDETFRITDVYRKSQWQVGNRAGAHLSAPTRRRVVSYDLRFASFLSRRQSTWVPLFILNVSLAEPPAALAQPTVAG